MKKIVGFSAPLLAAGLLSCPSSPTGERGGGRSGSFFGRGSGYRRSSPQFGPEMARDRAVERWTVSPPGGKQCAAGPGTRHGTAGGGMGLPGCASDPR
jgi:hypothetical protein